MLHHRVRCDLAMLHWVFLVAAGTVCHAATYSFTPLGDLAGGDFRSVAFGVSADGKVVVGWSNSTLGAQAFRWTTIDGMVGLVDPAGSDFRTFATAASADGSVIVGDREAKSTTPIIQEGFRWTNATNIVGVGGRFARGTSADGLVVVGQQENFSLFRYEAARWTSSGQIEGLGDLAGGEFDSDASAVSGDGTVVIGYGYSDLGREAFRWTSTSGMVSLGDFPGGLHSSYAYALSGDGSVVVGSGESASGREAFRWTSAGGMISLGDFPGGRVASGASAVSADGSVIVGTGKPEFSEDAFLWTSASGMVSLKQFLIDNGVSNLTAGWRLRGATGISADGRTIVGTGLNPQGQSEGWIATVPEPSAMVMAVGGLLALALTLIPQSLRRIAMAWFLPYHSLASRRDAAKRP